MATTYLSRTVTGSSTTKATYSAWVKRSGLGEKNLTAIKAGSDQCRITFTPDDELQVFMHDGSYQYRKVTDRLFRDTSGYYNIVIAFDSTEGAAGDRIKIYVNGVQETAFNNVTDPGASDDCFWFQSATGYLGIEENGSSNGFDGLMTHINMIQGTAYAASTFGEFDSTSGIWKIKTGPSVTYGSQGFFLKMETTSGSGMGTDSSGNGNNYAENGSPTQTVDNPSNVMCTLNSLFVNDDGDTNALTKGNNTYTSTNRSEWNNMVGTLGAATGKYYWEVKYTQLIDTSTIYMGDEGVGSADLAADNKNLGEGTRSGYGYGWLCANRNTTGNTRYLKTVDGTPTLTTDSNNTPVIVNDVVGVAWDGTGGKLWFHKNGTWIDDLSGNVGDPTNGTYPYHTGMQTGILYTPWGDVWQNSSGSLLIKSYNFGNGYFGTTQISSAGTSSTDDESIWEYDCPTGFYGLNTKNINTYG